jgi:hypothetical protein
MKRDLDLIRAILIEVEKLPADGRFHDISVREFTDEEISDHVHLSSEAGLLEEQGVGGIDGIGWKPERLTAQGQQFLHAIRTHAVYAKLQVLAEDDSGTLSVGKLKSAITLALKTLVGY